MCFNPGDGGQGVLEAYVVEKLANSLNERFVAACLDRVVPKKTNAVHTVGEKIDALRSAGSVFLGVPREPLQGVLIPSVVSGTGGAYPVELSGVSNDGSPQRGLRGIGAVSKHSPPCLPRGEGSRSIGIENDVRGG